MNYLIQAYQIHAWATLPNVSKLLISSVASAANLAKLLHAFVIVYYRPIIHSTSTKGNSSSSIAPKANPAQSDTVAGRLTKGYSIR